MESSPSDITKHSSTYLNLQDLSNDELVYNPPQPKRVRKQSYSSVSSECTPSQRINLYDLDETDERLPIQQRRKIKKAKQSRQLREHRANKQQHADNLIHRLTLEIQVLKNENQRLKTLIVQTNDQVDRFQYVPSNDIAGDDMTLRSSTAVNTDVFMGFETDEKSVNVLPDWSAIDIDMAFSASIEEMNIDSFELISDYED